MVCLGNGYSIETLLNVGIFVFIGFMLGLNFKEISEQNRPAEIKDLYE